MQLVSLDIHPYTTVAFMIRRQPIYWGCSFPVWVSIHTITCMTYCRNDEPPSRSVRVVIATSNTKNNAIRVSYAFTRSPYPSPHLQGMQCVNSHHARLGLLLLCLDKPTAFIIHSTCTGTPLIRDRRYLPRAKVPCS